MALRPHCGLAKKAPQLRVRDSGGQGVLDSCWEGPRDSVDLRYETQIFRHIQRAFDEEYMESKSTSSDIDQVVSLNLKLMSTLILGQLWLLVLSSVFTHYPLSFWADLLLELSPSGVESTLVNSCIQSASAQGRASENSGTTTRAVKTFVEFIVGVVPAAPAPNTDAFNGSPGPDEEAAGFHMEGLYDEIERAASPIDTMRTSDLGQRTPIRVNNYPVRATVTEQNFREEGANISSCIRFYWVFFFSVYSLFESPDAAIAMLCTEKRNA